VAQRPFKDEPMDPKRSLSEISHLFLSDVRSQQSGDAPRPKRIPPGAARVDARIDASIDLTAEEFAAAMESENDALKANTFGIADEGVAAAPAAAQISIVMGSHLKDQSRQGIRLYARQIASEVGRIGLIEVDAADLYVSCFEAHGGQAATPSVVDELDTRRISETLSELSFDVDRWLISLPNPRTAEARDLLRAAPHWALLTTADHDGVIATYRALKGLAELGRPAISLVSLNARDEAQADAVLRKLDSVGRQFLGCEITGEPPVQPVQDITEHFLLHCRATRDKAQLAAAPQWRVLTEFMQGKVAPVKVAPVKESSEIEGNPMRIETPAEEKTTHSTARPAEPLKPAIGAGLPSDAAPRTDAFAVPPKQAAIEPQMTEVIELGGDIADEAILNAVVRQGGADGKWVQCPLRPPMCKQAILAIGRDHRLIMLAMPGEGFANLKSIGLALKWMSENGELIRMALPQLAIEATSNPTVHLLVDHADLSAEMLQPLLHIGVVTVQAYRRLKWGQRRGLLLEAA
jgi:hypothetical protein